jgi:5'-3' exonuclease
MSRLNIIEEHNDGINEIIKDLNAPKESKVVIIDADSLSYICSYQPKTNEFGNPTVYYTKENGGYEIVEGFLMEKLLGIYNKIEEYFNISNIYLCVKGKNNPRNQWLTSYKEHRPPTPDIVKHLHSYLINHLGAYVAPIGEADDVIYSISKTIGHQGLICGIDKDLKSIPGCHYQYSKNIFSFVTEKEARFNFWKQVLMGDSSDFKGLSPGIGEKYALKVLNIDFTEEQYKEVVYQGFLKAWKNNEELATKNMELAYNLVKLWDIEELKLKEIK